ncbi:DUF5753 domain-containing protein [Nocardia mexicana]|uniref:DUF5753 domain-containing protein n=1 Tax=Nocardia mexicana TaxID=279262 RepID=A0A370GMI6_9NOCA|nr:DUF5753 domain-containing protein [Nocardia mexicana]RDI44881.1 hypothetical protein DFR68_11533 [Nocardia mexicana]
MIDGSASVADSGDDGRPPEDAVLLRRVLAGRLRKVRHADAARHRHLGAEAAPLWMDTYLALEDSSSLLRYYAPGVIPDLLQTPAYAREVAALARPGAAADIQQQIDLLLKRQEILDRATPPRLWVVIEQAALRRQPGGHQVWRDQLHHLARAAERPNITVQIMPDHACGPLISAVPFVLLRLADADLGDIVHIHHATDARFLDKSSDLDAYHTIWDRLCVNAVRPDRTSDIITAAADGSHL